MSGRLYSVYLTSNNRRWDFIGESPKDAVRKLYDFRGYYIQDLIRVKEDSIWAKLRVVRGSGKRDSEVYYWISCVKKSEMKKLRKVPIDSSDFAETYNNYFYYLHESVLNVEFTLKDVVWYEECLKFGKSYVEKYPEKVAACYRYIIADRLNTDEGLAALGRTLTHYCHTLEE